MLDNDWTGNITGQIRDDLGQPITAAQVLVVVKTWPDQSYFQRAYTTLSDTNGRFLIQNVHPVNERFEVQIAAVARNRALKSAYYSAPGGTLAPVVLELPSSSNVLLQVESELGATLASVEVLPHARVEASGAEHVVYFDSAQALLRRTDAHGRIELPYFQVGDAVTILIRTTQGTWETREFVVPTDVKVVTIRISQLSLSTSKES